MLNRLIERAVELSGLELSENETLSISFVGPKTIADVNKEFVGHEGVTDVICFNYKEMDDDRDFVDNDEEIVAIDILVCPDVASKAAEKHQKRHYSSEMVLYIVHGILHAAGEDDLDPVSRRRMRKRERFVMSRLVKEFNFLNVFPFPSQTDQ